MRLFALLIGFGVLTFSGAQIIAPPEPVDPTKVDRVVVVHPGESIQAAVDSLAGFSMRGGTVQLDPSATYRDVAVVIPGTSPRYYNAIKIRGNRTRLVSPRDSQQPVLWIGKGWDDWSAEKLEGIELSGLIIEQTSEANPGIGKGVYVSFTKGAVIRDCDFIDCPFEALFEEGGNANEQLTVLNCRAFRCGTKWSRGPLAAFNLNGFGSRIINSLASHCGWGLESGGTELRVDGCRFEDAPLALGSTVYGQSDVQLARNTFDRSPITIGNGIGRQSDVRILDNTLIDSPLQFCGAASANKVQLPNLPFHDRQSLVAGNTFLGESIRLTAWDKSLPIPPLRVVGNRIEAAPRQGIVVQGYLGNAVEFVDNGFSSAEVGVAWCYLPGGKPASLPDPTPMLKWARSRAPDKAYFLVNDGNREWKSTIN